VRLIYFSILNWGGRDKKRTACASVVFLAVAVLLFFSASWIQRRNSLNKFPVNGELNNEQYESKGNDNVPNLPINKNNSQASPAKAHHAPAPKNSDDKCPPDMDLSRMSDVHVSNNTINHSVSPCPPQIRIKESNDVTLSGNTLTDNRGVQSNTASPTIQNSAPNGMIIDGGNVTNPTVNNYGVKPPPPNIKWESIDMTQPIGAKHPQTSGTIVVDSLFQNPIFVVICSRACDWVNFNVIGYNQGCRATIPGEPNVAAYVVLIPNPFPPGLKATFVVESLDDIPVKIVSVTRLDTPAPFGCG
jgi:hypothetical protein